MPGWKPPERKPREVFPGKAKERDRRAWSPPSPRHRKIPLPVAAGLIIAALLIFWGIPALIHMLAASVILQILAALGALLLVVLSAEHRR